MEKYYIQAGGKYLIVNNQVQKVYIKNEIILTVVLPLLPHMHNPLGMFCGYRYNTVLCICTLVLGSLLQDESEIQILEDVSSCILAMDPLMNWKIKKK